LSCLASAPATGQLSCHPLCPQPIPPRINRPFDGATTLAAFQGKVVFLNFWATWCGPCRAEVPDLVALQERYKDHLQIIGLDVDDDDTAEIQKYVKETGIDYPVAMTPDDLRTQYGGIPALPTSFILDTEGRVVQKHVGYTDPSFMRRKSCAAGPYHGQSRNFEDKARFFQSDRATELPGVDLSNLSPEQKKIALHRFNADSCTCGCKYTLAQCRVWDSGCVVSKAATEKIITEVSGRPRPPASLAAPLAPPIAPAKSDPALKPVANPVEKPNE
jgi:thiol-disulfide isomerase/thioredoxin